MNEKLKLTIIRVGEKYLQAPGPLRVTIGKIIAGDLKVKKERPYKNNYMNLSDK